LWNLVIRQAIKVVGLYYHFLPTSVQGRKVIWEGMTNDGERFIDYIPPELVVAKNEQEMKIVLWNGSIIQVVGTDHYDSIRGTNPLGVVFSEYAYQHPMAWEVVKPILNANGGWAAFDTTPNGNNHAKTLWDMACGNPDTWFTSKLSIEDTNIVPLSVIEQERAEGVEEGILQQEYWCSFEAGAVGSYYAKNVQEARREGRVCDLEEDASVPVDLFFDLGSSDATAIGFVQAINGQVRFIDFYEKNQEDISHYLEVIRAKSYTIGKVYLPHDAFAKRLESPSTIADQFEAAGFQVERVPNISILNGTQLVRKMFPRTYFDKKNTSLLLSALENYHKEYNVETKTYKDTPKHDWSSHAADMVRYVAVIYGNDVEPDTASEERELRRMMRSYESPTETDIFDLRPPTEEGQEEDVALQHYLQSANTPHI